VTGRKLLSPRSVKEARTPRTVQGDALFRAASDQAPHVIWIVNAKGAVTYLNQAWYDLVGGLPPKWHGHEWGERVHPDDLHAMREQWKSASKTGVVFEGVRRVRARDDSWHTLSFKGTPVFDDKGLACWVGMDFDITEMVAAESALRVANQELEAFSHSVSHDLRTPLMTLRGFGSLLANELAGSANAKARHYLDRMTGAVDHMGILIDGLLALSGVSRAPLERRPVDLSHTARGILAMLQRLEPGRDVAIHVEDGLVVQGDGRLLAAMLENLLGNAWKFTSRQPRAEITMGLALRLVHEDVFFIRDNGAGFDMKGAARLFSAFERLHSAADFPGTGIGLATVHRVVARHGGRVWAESYPGGGACFYVALPRNGAPGAATAEAGPP
jgi:PAS domain S-box-containing protein